MFGPASRRDRPATSVTTLPARTRRLDVGDHVSAVGAGLVDSSRSPSDNCTPVIAWRSLVWGS